MTLANWTVQAEQDVEDIYGWIAVRDGRTQTAKNVLRAIRQECDDYADSFVSGSVLGTARPDLGESHRTITYKRWVIVLRPTSTGIEVMRVIDGSRDFSQIFGEHG